MKHKSGYLVYGRRTVQEFFKAGGRLDDLKTIHLLDNMAEKSGIPELKSAPPQLIKKATRPELDREFGDINHQGIILEFKKGIRPHKKVSDWKTFLKNNRGLFVALDEIQDPQNLGSIIRSAESLGAAALFITGHGSDLTTAADRASSGASFHIPIFTISSPSSLLEEARKNELWIVVAAGEEDTLTDTAEKKSKHQPLHVRVTERDKLPAATDLLLVIGNEGRGVRPIIRKNADYTVSIPMQGKTASLNAGVAAGILMDRILNETRI